MATSRHKIEVAAVANTDRLVRKLRAISHHTAELAAELEAIDADDESDGKRTAAAGGASTTWCACPTVTGGRVVHHGQCHLHEPASSEA